MNRLPGYWWCKGLYVPGPLASEPLPPHPHFIEVTSAFVPENDRENNFSLLLRTSFGMLLMASFRGNSDTGPKLHQLNRCSRCCWKSFIDHESGGIVCSRCHDPLKELGIHYQTNFCEGEPSWQEFVEECVSCYLDPLEGILFAVGVKQLITDILAHLEKYGGKNLDPIRAMGWAL